MNPERAISILQKQREQIPKLIGVPDLGNPDFTKWQRDTEVAVERIFGEQTRQVEDIVNVGYSLPIFTDTTQDYEFVEARDRGLKRADAILQSIIDEIQTYEIEGKEPTHPTSLNVLENLCLRFHSVARQLRARREDRPTLEVGDEYDVQDLTHALLKLHFDDIRAEEWSPSYAGAGSRIDFLLKSESIILEIKKTRSGLKDKSIGEQLIVDIARYSKHPDCKTLVCFVYDPEGLIGNPVGLEKDLEGSPAPFPIRVIIGPKN